MGCVLKDIADDEWSRVVQVCDDDDDDDDEWRTKEAYWGNQGVWWEPFDRRTPYGSLSGK